VSREVDLAIIGGSGFYEIDGFSDVEQVEIETPFGLPSGPVVLGDLAGVRLAFLPRHGAGHRLLPGEVPQRANVWALASLGTRFLLSISAVGSLKEEIAPLDMVVPDQLIDRTSGRPQTFFGNGIAAHIAFDTPFCPVFGDVVADCTAAAGVTVHRGGTLVVIEGPAFSTRAESEVYRGWGGAVIGMTTLPEAKLAREAGIHYASLACVTDYDTWHPGHAAVSVELIVDNLRKNVTKARTIAGAVAGWLPPQPACGCDRALRNAIITPLDRVPEQTLRDLTPILRRRDES
jgi:5'-methylthioadenosine phosphorylase